jgi:hypothetical protein
MLINLGGHVSHLLEVSTQRFGVLTPFAARPGQGSPGLIRLARQQQPAR